MGDAHSGEVTRVLESLRRGDQAAADRLLPLVYDELRALARSRLAGEPGGGAGLTLQPTALVHEAYLRLVGEHDAQWQNHAHFFSAAAIAMRRILIERARRKRTARDASADATQLGSGGDPESIDLLALDRALDKLAGMDQRLTEVVQLRFFAGLTVEQAAQVMGVSDRTVKRDWTFARAWLHREMTGDAPPHGAEA